MRYDEQKGVQPPVKWDPDDEDDRPPARQAQQLLAKVAQSYWWLGIVLAAACILFFEDCITISANAETLGGDSTLVTTALVHLLPLAVFAADSALAWHSTRGLSKFWSPLPIVLEAGSFVLGLTSMGMTMWLLKDHPFFAATHTTDGFSAERADFIRTHLVVSLILQPLALLKPLVTLWRQSASNDLLVSGRGRMRLSFGPAMRQGVLMASTVAVLLGSLSAWAYAQRSEYISSHAIEEAMVNMFAVDSSAELERYVLNLRSFSNWQLQHHELYLASDAAGNAYLAVEGRAISAAEAQAYVERALAEAGGPFAYLTATVNTFAGGAQQDATVAILIERAHFFEQYIAEQAMRKAPLLATTVFWVLVLLWIAEALVLRPVQRTTKQIVDLAHQLDDSGMVLKGRARASVSDGEVLSLEQAMTRVSATVRLVLRASMRGRVVLDRMMAEAATDGLTDLGLGEWQRMYVGEQQSSAGSVAITDATVGERSMRTSAAGRSSTQMSLAESLMRQQTLRTSQQAATGDRSSVTEGPVSELAADPQLALLGTPKWSALNVEPDESGRRSGGLQAAVVEMFRRLGILAASHENKARGAEEGAARASVFPTAETVVALCGHLELGYDASNPYHNWYHAVDVAHTAYHLMMEARKHERSGGFTRLERLCCLVAALAHDLGHTGKSNDFLIKTSHSLAVTYNDSSPQEQAHSAMLTKILLEDPESDVFARFGASEKRHARHLVIALITSTDMKTHFDLTGAVEELAEGMQQQAPPPGGGAHRLPSDKQHRELLLKAILHAADISHLVKDRKVMLMWSARIMSEFFIQGDMEKELGMSPVSMIDREKEYVPQGQLGFMDAVARPFFTALCNVIPWSSWMMRHFFKNYNVWLDVVREHQALLKAYGLETRDDRSSSEAVASSGTTRSHRTDGVVMLNHALIEVARPYSMHHIDFFQREGWTSVLRPSMRRPWPSRAKEDLERPSDTAPQPREPSGSTDTTSGAHPESVATNARVSSSDNLAAKDAATATGAAPAKSRFARHDSRNNPPPKSPLGPPRAEASSPAPHPPEPVWPFEAADETSKEAIWTETMHHQGLVYMPLTSIPRAAALLNTQETLRVMESRLEAFLDDAKDLESLPSLALPPERPQMPAGVMGTLRRLSTRARASHGMARRTSSQEGVPSFGASGPLASMERNAAAKKSIGRPRTMQHART
ncbi:unnamed protein product [Pedinophyceae sp. YPF-701]|nr:unnamed protein product [Pedinophyceae sp. YPF-701]